MSSFPFRRTSALVVAAVSIALLSACQTAYQPQGFTGGGYSESWRGEDKVVVTFEGNVATRPAVAEDLAMLRAADLAVEKGYTHFVVRHAGESDQAMTLGPKKAIGPGEYIFPYAAFGTDASGGAGGGTLYKRGARLYVVFLKEPPPTMTGVYDARVVQSELGRLYKDPDRAEARAEGASAAH
jgi:hypothetical protein